MREGPFLCALCEENNNEPIFISRSSRLFALCPRGSLRRALAAHHMRWTPAFAHALLRVKGIKRPSDLARLHVCFLVYVARKLFC